MAGVAWAQTAPAASAQTAGNAAPQSQVPTYRSSSELVVLDVIVTDAHGHPLRGLKLEDFSVAENGTAVGLHSVDDHTAGGPVLLETVPTLPKHILTNRPTAAPNDEWDVLLYDNLNTPLAAQAFANQQMQKFLATLPPNRKVALFRLDTNLHLLSPFASGGDVIKVLTGKAAPPQVSPLLQTFSMDDYVASHEQGMKTYMRAAITADAFVALADWLAAYPGRKSIYWLSGSFPMVPHVEGLNAHDALLNPRPFKGMFDFTGLIKRMNNRLAAARVAVFPLDVRGVGSDHYEGIQDASTSGPVSGFGGMFQTQADDQRVYRIDQEHAQMQAIAEATGGVARVENNDLAAILGDEFRVSQLYYTLSYKPVNKSLDGNFRKIKVTVHRPGTRLAYRSGYYAMPETPSKPISADEFTMAMRHGAPPATGVIFELEIKPNTDHSKLVIQYKVDPATLTLATLEGTPSAEFDCAVIAYNDKAQPLAVKQLHVHGRPPGFFAEQAMVLPTGATSLRIGVRDQATGRFGTLEVAPNN